MKMIAAMQARSGTVRGAPPRVREGGGGSSGWTRCHSWSGNRRSARVVMRRDHPRRPSAAIGHVHRAVDIRSLVVAGGVHRGLAGERVHDIACSASPGLAPSASLSRVQTFMLMTIPMISRISSCEKCSASAS